MTYFDADFLKFLRGLSRNNRREWYHDHKKQYEAKVKRPFHEFVEEIIHRVGALDPSVRIEPKDAIFRLARDIRFSKDKTPYKTFVSAVISPGGRKDNRNPAFYFQFGATSAGIAGGLYRPDRDTVYCVRRKIQSDGKRLSRILGSKTFRELFGELQGDKNKIVPKEFKESLAAYPLIANKQFFYWAEYDDPEIVLRPDLADFVMRHYRAGRKVNDFLKQALEDC